MLVAKTALALVLVVGLAMAGVVGTIPANAQRSNNEPVINQVAGGSKLGIVINEVETNPRGRDAGNEWIELYNPTSSNIDIGNFAVQTSSRLFTLTIPAGTVIEAGQFYVIKFEGERLSNILETLTLVDPAGNRVDRTPSLPDRFNDDRTWQRIPDGSSTWRFTAGTPGEPNDPATYQSSNQRKVSPALTGSTSSPQCLGSALCIEGKVIRMVDTDTLYVQSGMDIYKVDLSLTKVSKSDRTYKEGAMLTKRLCLGSNVLVDQDDKQPWGQGSSRGHINAVVYCSSYNLNQELLDSGFVSLDYRQCFVSEFAGQDWAKRNGCK